MTTKPCIQCGEACDVFHLMLGDTYTLTYLRICDNECLFYEAYDYLYRLGEHKSFRIYLNEKQDIEDKKDRDEFIEIATKQFLEHFEKIFSENSGLLSQPIPQGIFNVFKDVKFIPQCSGPIRITRPCYEDRVRWARERANALEKQLVDAKKELWEIENEG